MLNFKEVPFDLKLFSDRNKLLSICLFVRNNVRARSKWFSSLSHLVRVTGVTRAYRTAAESPGAGQ